MSAAAASAPHSEVDEGSSVDGRGVGEQDGLGRQTVLELLAGFGDRAPGDVHDEIGSLELTWLIAHFEQRYSVVVDLDDVELSLIRTVGEALDALRAVLGLPPLEPADGV
jgi:hypothetical protein